jgi:hypothetical protein
VAAAKRLCLEMSVDQEHTPVKNVDSLLLSRTPEGGGEGRVQEAEEVEKTAEATSGVAGRCG